SRTHSAGVMGAGGGAHGHFVGDAGRPPTGTDAACAQTPPRAAARDTRADFTLPGSAVCGSGTRVAQSHDRSGNPASRWHTAAHHVQCCLSDAGPFAADLLGLALMLQLTPQSRIFLAVQ